MKKRSFIFYLILLVQVISPTLYAMEQPKAPTLQTACIKKLQKTLHDVLQNIELNKPYTRNTELLDLNLVGSHELKKLLYKEYHQELDTIFSKLKPTRIYTLQRHHTNPSITTSTIDYNNKSLFAGLEDGNIEIWDLRTQKIKTILNTEMNLPIVNIKISPKSTILNATSLNGEKKSWNINTKKSLQYHQSLPKMNSQRHYTPNQLLQIGTDLPPQPQINLSLNDFFVIEIQDDIMYLRTGKSKLEVLRKKIKPNNASPWKKMPPAFIDSNSTLVVSTPNETIEIFKIYSPQDLSFLKLILLIKLQQAANQGYLQSIKLNEEWEDVLRNHSLATVIPTPTPYSFLLPLCLT